MKLLWVVMICQALFSIALRGSRPIVSLYADILGASPLFIGFLVSSFAFLPMLFAIKAGKWLDRYGAKQITLIGTTGMLVSLILPVLLPTLPVLFLNQLIIGISHICVLVSLQKTVGNLPGERDRVVAGFSIAGSLGEFLGPITTGVLFEQMGFRWTFSTMVVTVIIAGIVSTALPKNTQTSFDSSSGQQKQKRSGRDTWLMLRQINLRKALIISGLVLYSKDLFIGYFPVYGNSVGLTPSQIGLVISLSSGMAVVIRLLQFRLVHLFGRGHVMTVTLIISGISFLLIPTTEMISVLILFSMMLGAGLGLGQPLSLVYTMNVSQPERQGEVLGLRLTFNRASQFIAPFIFGAIGQVAGIAPVFLLSGTILFFGSYFTRIRENDGTTKEIQNNSQYF